MSVKTLTKQQEDFLMKVLDIGLSVIIPNPKLCDRTRGTSDAERIKKGWCWSQDKRSLEQTIRKVIYNGEYDGDSYNVGGSAFFISLGTYYTRWKEETDWLNKIKNY